MQHTRKYGHSSLSDWHSGQPDRLMVDTTTCSSSGMLIADPRRNNTVCTGIYRN